MPDPPLVYIGMTPLSSAEDLALCIVTLSGNTKLSKYSQSLLGDFYFKLAEHILYYKLHINMPISGFF